MKKIRRIQLKKRAEDIISQMVYIKNPEGHEVGVFFHGNEVNVATYDIGCVDLRVSGETQVKVSSYSHRKRWTSRELLGSVNYKGREVLEASGQWIEFEDNKSVLKDGRVTSWKAWLCDDKQAGPTSQEAYEGPNGNVSNYRGD
jgi:hypothetical protein